MVGLSLSLCIADIIRGRVNPIEVSLIVADTKAADDATFGAVIERYRETYWRDNPRYGEALAIKLWVQGRIIQPRLLEQHHDHNIAMGHWVITNEPVVLGRDGELYSRCESCGRVHHNEDYHGELEE